GTVRSRLHYAKEALYAMLSDTELSPDFTERLIKATRPKTWLFRRSSVASAVAVFGFLAFAAGSAVVLGRSGASALDRRTAGRQSAPAPAETGLWKMAGNVSLFDAESDEIDRAVEGGLRYIASQQRENGSFGWQWGESAAIPALAGMACLSKGHLPGTEPYGKVVERCLDYVFSVADMRDQAPYRGYMGAAGDGRMYAHSIATLFLSEMSGMVDIERQKKIDALLPFAVKVILDAQSHPKNDGSHMGGWRYTPDAADSDLSCSGWALMALRSARLNGALMPPDAIEKAVLYIKRSQREGDGAFGYQGANGGYAETLSGAGILCLELCGRHLDPCSLKAADFVRKTFRAALAGNGATYYALYYTSQGLFQVGGEAWREFEAWMYGEFMRRQNADGSWQGGGSDAQSPVYSTAMTTLALTVPYRMLPIYQRDETVDAEEEQIQGEQK
ncbi:MAG: terpene cyclase/mutase family protein, partial [Kiritimatiellae bacterium]|nr:terpene cyclase/mutase family protein [Kiritimatiellia bacterium]